MRFEIRLGSEYSPTPGYMTVNTKSEEEGREYVFAHVSKMLNSIEEFENIFPNGIEIVVDLVPEEGYTKK